MTMPAVQDPPENPAKPDAAPPNGEGTPSSDPKSQADPKDSNPNGTPNGDGAPANDGGDGDKSDPIKVAQEAAIEAWKAENLDKEVDARIAEKQKQARDTQTDADYGAEFNGAIKDISAALKGIKFEAKGEDGQPVTFSLTDAQIQEAVHNRLNKMRGAMRGLEEAEIYDDLATEALKLLGGDKDKAEAFTKEAGGKPIGQWLSAVVEHAAAESKYVKNLLKQHEADKKAEYARGWEEAKGAPPGQPSMKDSKNVNTGKLQKAQWESMSREERADAWRDRADEVREMLGQS